MSTPAAVRYVECLSTLCVHDGRPVVANQNLIIELLIKVKRTHARSLTNALAHAHARACGMQDMALFCEQRVSPDALELR